MSIFLLLLCFKKQKLFRFLYISVNIHGFTHTLHLGPLFTRREGDPGARVNLARGLP